MTENYDVRFNGENVEVETMDGDIQIFSRKDIEQITSCLMMDENLASIIRFLFFRAEENLNVRRKRPPHMPLDDFIGIYVPVIHLYGNNVEQLVSWLEEQPAHVILNPIDKLLTEL